ncbi:MAG: hypothetical protein NTU93_01900 [Arthrobacter sp.]|nr:hypothetical protein [Arthrobacter sp.]
MYAHLAIHHPAPDRFAQALAAAQVILDSIEGAQGLQEGYVGHNSSHSEVFAMTLWQEPGQFAEVFPAVQAAVSRTGIRSWEVQSPDVLKFVEVED